MTRTLTQLEELHRRLTAARCVQDVFGDLGTVPQKGLQMAFQKMVQVAHPDHAPDDVPLARQTFALLLRWCDRAREMIAGRHVPPVGFRVITGPRGAYRVREPGVAGDYAAIYLCESGGVALLFKITSQPSDNALAVQEAQALQHLQNVSARGYFPQLVDSFQAADGTQRRQVVVYGTGSARHSLRDVGLAFPRGIDPRDAAWMFNRLLEALCHTHHAGLAHGAIVPANILIDIENHGLVLTEWGYSLRIGERPWAISGAHEDWYPPEVFAKTPASPAMDIFMAAHCLAYLLGPGEPPPAFRAFLRGCLLPAGRRPTDAGALREEFGELLRSLYGKPAFRRFAMPT